MYNQIITLVIFPFINIGFSVGKTIGVPPAAKVKVNVDIPVISHSWLYPWA